MHQVLGHDKPESAKLHKHRLVGMQLDILKNERRVGEYARIFPQSGNCVEVPVHGEDSHTNRPYFPSFVPGHEPGRQLHRDRRR